MIIVLRGIRKRLNPKSNVNFYGSGSTNVDSPHHWSNSRVPKLEEI